ncbi:MAG TPA: DUF1826 domain-containing protein [Solirubrobacteraceae bacterium]|nr:DUF1826 domain-containing protein [Solirubrobacteraceae bacterium]
MLRNPSRKLCTAPRARRVHCTETPQGVEQLHDPSVDLWLWQRTLSRLLSDSAARLAARPFALRLSVAAAAPRVPLTDALDRAGVDERSLHLWAHELSTMVELLGRLGHSEVLVRLEGGSRVGAAPRYHVDGTSVRLLCTYAGPGTEWLPEHAVDRRQLKRRRSHPPPTSSRIARHPRAVQRTQPGWVAIIRGASGESALRRGLVHRSPASTVPRLRLRIDPAAERSA